MIMDLHCRSARSSRCFPHDESGQHFFKARTRNNIVRKGCKRDVCFSNLKRFLFAIHLDIGTSELS